VQSNILFVFLLFPINISKRTVIEIKVVQINISNDTMLLYLSGCSSGFEQIGTVACTNMRNLLDEIWTLQDISN
jgi:hypothetical protein